jgi:hypothetical protein
MQKIQGQRGQNGRGHSRGCDGGALWHLGGESYGGSLLIYYQEMRLLHSIGHMKL